MYVCSCSCTRRSCSSSRSKWKHARTVYLCFIEHQFWFKKIFMQRLPVKWIKTNWDQKLCFAEVCFLLFLHTHWTTWSIAWPLVELNWYYLIVLTDIQHNSCVRVQQKDGRNQSNIHWVLLILTMTKVSEYMWVWLYACYIRTVCGEYLSRDILLHYGPFVL